MARATRQLGFEFRTWGGARAHAGRPPKARTAGVSHLRRPPHSCAHPLHVTLRVLPGVASLRGPALFAAVRGALARGKQQFGFSLVHFSVQRDHLHLIAEAQDRRALARGMQGLSIRVARAVNAQLGRRGRLFADRYHARALTTPRTVRLALRYVLLNLRKHIRGPKGPADAPVSRRASPETLVQNRASPNPLVSRRASPLRTPTPITSASLPGDNTALPAGFVDACSSAPWFTGFGRPLELVFGARSARNGWERSSSSSEPPIVAPECWLLRSGWKRAGPFEVDDTPGSKRQAR
jgi:putative transposase